MENRAIRDALNDIWWLLSLGTFSAYDRVLATVDDLRRRYVSGWWDDSLARAEDRAKAALKEFK